MYEYAIVTDSEPNLVHRGPLSQDEAEEWMHSLPHRLKAMFRIAKREVSPWEVVEDGEIK